MDCRFVHSLPILACMTIHPRDEIVVISKKNRIDSLGDNLLKRKLTCRSDEETVEGKVRTGRENDFASSQVKYPDDGSGKRGLETYLDFLRLVGG